jgi:hypothetical protein
MTFPIFAAGDVLGAADMNAVGMWRANPTSVSGTGATLANNKITLSACTAVVINGAFTANYENYLLVMRLSQTGGDVFVRLASGGTELATNTYNWSLVQAYAGAGVTTSRTGNTDSVPLMSNNNGSWGSATMDIFAPQVATPTLMQIHNFRNDGNLQTPANYQFYGNNTNSTGYDGLRIFCAGGMTGTIFIYGRN